MHRVLYFVVLHPHHASGNGSARPHTQRRSGRGTGPAQGHVLMGYDTNGRCPMLADGKCSIYEHRPHTCRNYDCRVFTAAGIVAGADDKAEINTRVRRWDFAYPTAGDRDEHRAVQAAASFIREHPESFPSGRVPSDPSQLAILAIKAYEVFVEGERTADPGGVRSASDVANAIVEMCRRFDAGMARSMGHRPPLG